MRRAYAYGMAKRTRYVTQAVPQGGRLLDLGCATGTFLAAVRAHGGWQVEGVELIDEVAQAARARHNLKIFSGTKNSSLFFNSRIGKIDNYIELKFIAGYGN